MLIRYRDFQKIVIWLLMPAIIAAFIILPDFVPLAVLPATLFLIGFLEIVRGIRSVRQQRLCTACHFEIGSRSPPTV